MKKRILLILTTLLLAAGLTAMPVFAEEDSRVMCADPAYCIESDDDLHALNLKLAEISKKQKCDVVIYTTTTFDEKTPTEYADDFYDYYEYGQGEDDSGILLVINPETRDWAISTQGFGITAFTDAGQEYIIDQMSPALSEDDYLTAFNQYADLCDQFLTQAHTGEPYDNGNLPGQEKGIIIILDILAGLIIGVIVAFIIVGRDKAALKTVRREAAARNYMRPGSLQITGQYERFLYSDVDRTERESSSGSSTHESSSGETHGGSSGKF